MYVSEAAESMIDQKVRNSVSKHKVMDSISVLGTEKEKNCYFLRTKWNIRKKSLPQLKFDSICSTCLAFACCFFFIRSSSRWAPEKRTLNLVNCLSPSIWGWSEAGWLRLLDEFSNDCRRGSVVMNIGDREWGERKKERERKESWISTDIKSWRDNNKHAGAKCQGLACRIAFGHHP